MKIKEFLNLSYGEANALLKKAIPGLIDGRKFNVDDFKAKLSIQDAIWSPSLSDMDGKTTNASIKIKNKWYKTKVRVILSFKYSDDIQICYYIGNTANNSTLKEISFKGIVTYWSEVYPELESINLTDTISVKVPETTYGNGRKGSVGDMLNKKYNMLKLKLDYAISEIKNLMKDNKFINLWINTIDSDHQEKPTRLYGLPRDLQGTLGNYLVSLISDGSNLSSKDIVLFIKTLSGYFNSYPQTRSIGNYFCGKDINLTGLTSNNLNDLKELREKIEKHLELDRKLDLLSGFIQSSYTRSIDEFLLIHPEIENKKLKKLLKIELEKNIDYEDL